MLDAGLRFHVHSVHRPQRTLHDLGYPTDELLFRRFFETVHDAVMSSGVRLLRRRRHANATTDAYAVHVFAVLAGARAAAGRLSAGVLDGCPVSDTGSGSAGRLPAGVLDGCPASGNSDPREQHPLRPGSPEFPYDRNPT